MRVNCRLALLCGMINFFLALQCGGLYAATGTARLTFQKTAIAGDGAQTYIIRKGDNVSRILRKLGKTAPSYETIRRLNPHISDLNRIYPGQRLILGREEGTANREEESAPFRNYTTRKGDSITRIILYELEAKPEDVVKLLRSIKDLNPEIKDFNRIYPGQILKIPEGGAPAIRQEKSLPVTGESPAADVEPPPSQPPPPPPSPAKAFLPKTDVGLLARIIRQLNGAVVSSGNYYIPLPESGQVAIDCAATPVIELADGTTVFLDFAGRLPEDLSKMVRASWPNYHFLKIGREEGIALVLQKVIGQSKSYFMEKLEKPFFLEDEPQVRVFLDWLITNKSPAGELLSRLALNFTADRSGLLPEPVRLLAAKKGIGLCEIMDGGVQEYGSDKTAYTSSSTRIKDDATEEMLRKFFILLGLEPVQNREVKIFDARKDGFDLSIKAELVVKRGSRILLIHKSRLPQQFIEVLRKEGWEPYYLSGEVPKKSLLEGILASLGIPSQAAVFSVSPRGAADRVAVDFFALKIESDKGTFYLVDFDMGQEVYELLSHVWKLRIVRY